jgi:hypothetical protein
MRTRGGKTEGDGDDGDDDDAFGDARSIRERGEKQEHFTNAHTAKQRYIMAM